MMVGIERLVFHAPSHVLDLRLLAAARGVDASKYLVGLGQERMAVPSPDEDIVTLGAEAAGRAMADLDPGSIDLLLFATESAVDQAKSAAVSVHRLLNLHASCKALEVKQACSSGALALLLAMAWVRMHPRKKVLLVAADTARYGLGSIGEPTQGAAGAALIVSSTPRLMALDPAHGVYTEDVMDFWRPNYTNEAMVDGKLSIRIYLKALAAAWRDYNRQGGPGYAEHHRFCYHLPFTRMAEKAHAFLAREAGIRGPAEKEARRYGPSLHFNRVIGNSYTASVFVALCSLLEHDQDLAGRRIGLFSYGSGCVGLFFGGTVLEEYGHYLDTPRHAALLAEREEISVARYETWYKEQGRLEDGTDRHIPRLTGGSFRLAGLENHRRIYESCSRPSSKHMPRGVSPVSSDVPPAVVA